METKRFTSENKNRLLEFLLSQNLDWFKRNLSYIDGNINEIPGISFDDVDKKKEALSRLIDSLNNSQKFAIYTKLFGESPKDSDTVTAETVTPVPISHTTTDVPFEESDTKPVLLHSIVSRLYRNEEPQRKNPSWPYSKIISMGLITGLVVSVVGVICSIVFSVLEISFLRDIALIIVGLGASILAGAFINIIWDKRMNNVALTIMEEATREAWSKLNKIRYEQNVTIEFEKKNKKVEVVTTHEFSYKVEELSKFNKKFCNVSIFSDFQGDFPQTKKDGSLAMPSCYFKKIEINGAMYSEWDYSKSVEEQKPLFQLVNGKIRLDLSDIQIPAQDYLRLKFVIHSEYKTQDRLVWIFQELSPSATVRIVRKNSVKRNVSHKFHISFNHPLAEDIISGNRQNGADLVDEETGRIIANEPSVEFNLQKIILPYQGFEVYWDVSK